MPRFASARMGDRCAPVSGTVPADTDESDCAGAAENTVCALSSPISTDTDSAAACSLGTAATPNCSASASATALAPTPYLTTDFAVAAAVLTSPTSTPDAFIAAANAAPNPSVAVPLRISTTSFPVETAVSI